MPDTQDLIAAAVVLDAALKTLEEAEARHAGLHTAIHEAEAERDRLDALPSLNPSDLLRQENVRRKLRAMHADVEAAARTVEAARVDVDAAEVAHARLQLDATEKQIRQLEDRAEADLRARFEATVREVVVPRLRERDALVNTALDLADLIGVGERLARRLFGRDVIIKSMENACRDALNGVVDEAFPLLPQRPVPTRIDHQMNAAWQNLLRLGAEDKERVEAQQHAQAEWLRSLPVEVITPLDYEHPIAVED